MTGQRSKPVSRPDHLKKLEGFSVVLVDARPGALDTGILRVCDPEPQSVNAGDHGREAGANEGGVSPIEAPAVNRNRMAKFPCSPGRSRTDPLFANRFVAVDAAGV